GDGVEFGEDESKLLDSAKTAGDSPVRNERYGFCVPFLAIRIDKGFQRGGVPVVVLRRDDNGGVASRQRLPESVACVCGIDVLDPKSFVGCNAGRGPAGNRVAEAARAG